jgi:hypothetical protein
MAPQKDDSVWKALLHAGHNRLMDSFSDLHFEDKFALEEFESIPGGEFTSINPILKHVGGHIIVLLSLSNWLCPIGAGLIEHPSGRNRWRVLGF